MSHKNKILIIDDEPQIRRILRMGLESQGFFVIEAVSGAEGLKHASTYLPDAVILDLGLPDCRGIEVLRQLREWSEVPVVILSVENDENEKVEALNRGADDYVTKPFGMNELIARVKVSLRHKRTMEKPEINYRFGTLEINLDSHLVWKQGKELRLTSTEFSLLKLFVRHAGKVLTHKMILKEIWGPKHEADTHYLRIYIGTLRKKIEEDPSEPKLIVTEPGVGYRLKFVE